MASPNCTNCNQPMENLIHGEEAYLMDPSAKSKDPIPRKVLYRLFRCESCKLWVAVDKDGNVYVNIQQ